MKIINLRKKLAVLTIAGMALPVSVGWAQNLPAPAPVQPAVVSAPTIQLSSGAQQVLQLSQAKISDDTIIAFVRNSMINYNLNANEIIYLRQQGISNPVIAAMLNQSGAVSSAAAAAAVPAATTATPMPMATPPVPAVSTDDLPVYTAPSATVVEPVPDTGYYDYPYYDPYYYGGYYPVGGVYIGGGWGWGGGWRGGGGWHGGGGFHGGGGGFHGGGGGGHR